MTRSSLSSLSLHLVAGTTVGNLLLAAGPAFLRFLRPTRVGAGASYFLAFLAFSCCASSPAPSPRLCCPPIAPAARRVACLCAEMSAKQVAGAGQKRTRSERGCGWRAVSGAENKKTKERLSGLCVKERKKGKPKRGMGAMRWGRRTGSTPARAGFWKGDQGHRWGSPAPAPDGLCVKTLPTRSTLSTWSAVGNLTSSEGP